MFDELTHEQVAAAVDSLVDELLDQARLKGPPVDALALAQGPLDMLICLDERQQQRGRAQRSGSKKQIFLRPEPREERHQWTVAHEIGEHYKSALLERLGLPPDRTRAMTGESLANLFAYRLLVPSRWFNEDASACEHDLLALKRRYGTASHEVLAWRFLDLPAPCVITIIDNDSIHRRRSNAYRIRKKLEPAEERCVCQLNECDEPVFVQYHGWTVQGWPIRELDWKRQILRSVVDLEDAVLIE